jgi:hypothetical protein
MQDGDCDGAFVLPGLPTEGQAAVLRRVLEIPKRQNLNNEQRQHRGLHLKSARMKSGVSQGVAAVSKPSATAPAGCRGRHLFPPERGCHII